MGYIYTKIFKPVLEFLPSKHPGARPLTVSRADHHIFNQPWYADDAGSGVTFAGIQWHLEDLVVLGPPQGYFL